MAEREKEEEVRRPPIFAKALKIHECPGGKKAALS